MSNDNTQTNKNESNSSVAAPNVPQGNTNFIGSTLSGASTLTAGYLSYLNDDLAKAWERNLMAPDMALDLSDPRDAKETLDLLWKTGDLTAVPTLQPSDRKTAKTPGENSQQPKSTCPNSTPTRRQSRSTRSSSKRATSQDKAWEVLSGYDTYGYTINGERTAPQTKQPSSKTSPANTRTGNKSYRSRYSTYGTTRTNSQANTNSALSSSLLRFIMILIIVILITTVVFVLFLHNYINDYREVLNEIQTNIHLWGETLKDL